MDLSNTPATRHDGWTPARRVHFLERLAQDGNVFAACICVGLSRESAYRLRRREPLFARAWAAAQACAREACAQALATRALDGVEEEVWYRGEVVGTRRRYDNRLLLAHMARLDKLAAASPRAEADAERFDELLARVGGMTVPPDLASNDPNLPATRDAHVGAACDEAERKEQAAIDALERECLGAGEAHDPDWAAFEAEATAAWNAAYAGATAEWDAWFDAACDTVDRLLAEPANEFQARAWTLSTVSTSAPTSPERGGGPSVAEGGGWGRGTPGES